MFVKMLRLTTYYKKYWIFLIAAIILSVDAVAGRSQELMISPKETEFVRYVNETHHVLCLSPQSGVSTSWQGPSGHKVAPYKGRIHTEERTNMGVALIFESIEQKDRGDYTCSSLVNGKQVKVVFKLFVIKPISFLDTPVVQNASEHKNALVRCEVDGDPKPTIVWHVKGVKLNDYNSKYQLGGDGLIIKNVSLNDRGEYKCRAYQTSNIISDYVDHIITLKIQHKPMWRSGERSVEAFAYLTGVVNLTCEAEAEPPAEYEWFKANKPIVPKKNITIIKETDKSILQLAVHNKTVFGEYSCTAKNGLGVVKRTFKLREGVKPEKPSHVSMSQTHITSVELNIKGPADRSDSLGYRVQYMKLRHKDHDKKWELAAIADLNKGLVYTVPDLEPDTSYSMRVASRNNAGVSDYSPALSVKTLKQSNAATVTASGGAIQKPALMLAPISLIFCTAVTSIFQRRL